MGYTRLRNRGGLIPAVALSTIQGLTADDLRLYPSTRDSCIGTMDSMEDYVTDRFYERSRAGETINNPLYLESERGIATSATWGGLFVPTWGTLTYSGEIAAVLFGDRPHLLPMLVQLSDVDWEKRLTTAAVNKSRSTVTTLGENILEARKTGAMIMASIPRLKEIVLRDVIPTARRLYKLYRAGKLRRKGLYKTANTFADFIAGAWLQYRYGWMPIYLTITSAVKTASALYDGDSKRIRGVSSTEKFSGTTAITVYDNTGYTVTGTQKTSVVGRYAAGVRYRVDKHHGLTELASQLMILPSDLPSLIWEITKFSWLFDWIINVGAWLEALNTPAFIHIDGSWATRELSSDTLFFNLSGEYQHPASLGDYKSTGSGSTYNRVTRTQTRVVDPHLSLGYLPPVDLNFNSVSLNHVLDFAALLRQVVNFSN